MVILEHELAVFKLDLRMATTNRDVVDTEITLVSSSKLEYLLLGRRSNYVDNTRVVLLLVETLEHKVISLLLLVLDQVVVPALRFQHQWVRLLADLALKRLPVVG